MMCTIDHKVVKFKNQKQNKQTLTIFMFIVLFKAIFVRLSNKNQKQREKQPEFYCNKADRGKNLVLKIEGGLNNQKGVSTGHQAGDNDFKNKIIMSKQTPEPTGHSKQPSDSAHGLSIIDTSKLLGCQLQRLS
jgi:hypothetical protein